MSEIRERGGKRELEDETSRKTSKYKGRPKETSLPYQIQM
jgi:hypothetical protein